MRTSTEAAAAGATFGIGFWLASAIVAIPVFSGRGPLWTTAGMQAAIPELVALTVAGAIAGLGARIFAGSGAADRLLRRTSARKETPPTRIVIVGGGFAGVSTAMALERSRRASAGLHITLVSETNALLFTPMLSEVAGSSLEAAHISSPTRTSLRQTTFVRARVEDVDFGRRIVRAADAEISYDHLVLALGSVPQYLGLTNVEQNALSFKTLLDAIKIRNRVIERFERADGMEDASERKRLLTFTIAGGGFAGAELAGALNDFARGIVVDYPRLTNDEVSIIVVHARERILPELSASLAAYALRRMQARGVVFKLNARVRDASPDSVVLDNGETIAGSTLIWTAGAAPHPLARALDLPCDKRGAVVVDETLAVAERGNVWAIGDCAAVTNGRTGQPSPPTAQFAIREAATLALNITAAIAGRRGSAFRFSALGALCVVGHQTACAELNVPFRREALQFSGFSAWLMWRAVYLAKLPGTERKIRVLLDWIVELFFPRDITQTVDVPD